MLPRSALCPGTGPIPSVRVSLLHVWQYVVLANRNCQCTSLSPIVASLTLFPIVGDRLALVLCQRHSVTGVLKRWPFMEVSLGEMAV